MLSFFLDMALRTWFRGEHGGSARLMVGLGDLRGPSQS